MKTTYYWNFSNLIMFLFMTYLQLLYYKNKLVDFGLICALYKYINLKLYTVNNFCFVVPRCPVLITVLVPVRTGTYGYILGGRKACTGTVLIVHSLNRYVVCTVWRECSLLRYVRYTLHANANANANNAKAVPHNNGQCSNLEDFHKQHIKERHSLLNDVVVSCSF